MMGWHDRSSRIAILIQGITVQPQSQQEFCNTIPPIASVEDVIRRDEVPLTTRQSRLAQARHHVYRNVPVPP